MIEQMMQDVDPVRVAASIAAKHRFMAEVDALPETRRCKGAPVNHDGSCFRCGDDQGEYARCATRAAAHPSTLPQADAGSADHSSTREG